MKTFRYVFLITIFSCISWFPLLSQYLHEGVTKLWETEDVLKIPESVLYDKSDHSIYVANINGGPTDKDGNGFISILDTKGKVKNVKWAAGLNAPKGMGIADGKLYVSDIDQLVEIDIETGEIKKKYDAPNAKFLNDVTIGPNKEVYVSDMRDNKIYKLENGQFGVWKTLTGEFDRPNGLFAEQNRLLVGLKDRVMTIDYASNNMDTFIENTGGIDGLVPFGNGHYLISDWQGRTHLISPGKEKVKLTDTTTEEVNAADIDYMMKDNILLIPTFMANTVAAYNVDISGK